MSDWAIAALPLLGVIIGAALQSRLGRSAEREKQVAGLRAQAYADYLLSVAAAAHLRSDQDLRDAHRETADAKARIAVYGSNEVISALARFEESGAALGSAGSRTAFVALVTRMRSASSSAQERDIEAVLFGTEQRGDPRSPGKLSR
jgi:head-tail adaptor